MGRTTRSGKSLAGGGGGGGGGRQQNIENVGGLRGKTRSGRSFNRDNAGYHTSLQQLKQAHPKIFSPHSSMAVVDLPVSDSAKGVLQAVLRLSVHDPDKTRSLVRAYKQLDNRYPGATFAVCVTANLVLRHSTKSTFKLYFGQSFGRAKSIFVGQRRDVEGKTDRLWKEYSVSSVMEAKALPTVFSKEEFGALFAQNYENSSVVVHSVVNLIYIFGLGLNNFVLDSNVGASLTTFW